MIVSPDWIWLHLPKSGGTATEAMLRELLGHRRDVAFDDTADRAHVVWHETIGARARRVPGFDAAGRPVAANLRRLPHWVLSYIHFEVQRRGERMAPPRRSVVAGFVPAPDGRPVPADQVIRRFAGEVTHWLRSDRLAQDAARILGLDPGQAALALERRNEGRIAYIRDLAFWFTPKNLATLYERNPIWAEVEARVYGDVLTL